MKENPILLVTESITGNENPKKIWYSRSVAVGVAITDGARFIFEKRGKGCPDGVGQYCLPCGYLNWDESCEEAVVREVYEEIGIKLDKNLVKAGLYKVDSNPSNNRQNVLIFYFYRVSHEGFDEFLKTANEAIKVSNRGGEENEVDEVVGINFFNGEDKKYDFAFNHDSSVHEAINYYGMFH